MTGLWALLPVRGVNLTTPNIRTYVRHIRDGGARLGQNKRYGSDLTDTAINEVVTRPMPISLSKSELGQEPVTTAEEPVDVQAWVRFPEQPIRVDGRAVAWTKRAVWVEFTMRNGATFRAWVWASAVDRKGTRKPPPAQAK